MSTGAAGVPVFGVRDSVLDPGSLFLYFSKKGRRAERTDDMGVSGVLGGSMMGVATREEDTIERSAYGYCDGEGERDATLFRSLL
jgi:hypothetical protein